MEGYFHLNDASEDYFDEDNSTVTTTASSSWASYVDEDGSFSTQESNGQGFIHGSDNNDREEDEETVLRIDAQVLPTPLVVANGTRNPMLSPIRLIDARARSLTVAWPAVVGAKYYHLEATRRGSDSFRIVLPKVYETQATIKKLWSQHEYYFWITPVLANRRRGVLLGSGLPQTPFRTLSSNQERTSMAAPTTYLDKTKNELFVKWIRRDTSTTSTSTNSSCQAYDLQFRDAGEESCQEWTTIGLFLEYTRVKITNLSPTAKYQFRVKPSKQSIFSPPSKPGYCWSSNNFCWRLRTRQRM